MRKKSKHKIITSVFNDVATDVNGREGFQNFTLFLLHTFVKNQEIPPVCSEKVFHFVYLRLCSHGVCFLPTVFVLRAF